MQYSTLGRTGLRVSRIGFGGAQVGIPNYMETWNPMGAVEQQTIVDALDHALDLGLNYIDTAPAYGDGVSEEVLGRVIGRRRSECIVATKTTTREPAAVAESVEKSLRRLRTDVIDVIQFHGGAYPEADVQQILEGGGLEAYQRLREQGKVRFLGFTAELPSGGVSRLISTGAFDVMQVRYNFMYQCSCDFINEAGIIREAEAAGMGVVTMRTMTSGIFQRLMRRAFPQLADADLNAFLLNYVLSNPFVDVTLIGMRRREEVDANTAVVDDEKMRLDLAQVHSRFFPPQTS